MKSKFSLVVSIAVVVSFLCSCIPYETHGIDMQGDAKEYNFERIEWNKASLCAAEAGEYLIYIDTQYNLIRYSQKDSKKEILQAFGDTHLGNQVFATYDEENCIANIFYTDMIKSSEVEEEYQEIFAEFFSNYPMSELYMYGNNEPIIPFMFRVLEVVDNKIVYLAEDFSVNYFDMITYETDKIAENRNEYTTKWRSVYSVDGMVDYTNEYIIILEENSLLIKQYSGKHSQVVISNDYTLFNMPEIGEIKDVKAINDKIFVVSKDHGADIIYVIDTAKRTISEPLYLSAMELYDVYVTADKYFTVFADEEENLKIFMYDLDNDKKGIIFEGEFLCKGICRGNMLNTHEFKSQRYMVLIGDILLGYDITEFGTSTLVFAVDITE